MDRSLRLLMALRTKAAFRRWGQSLKRPQGIIVAVVLGFLVLPWFGFMLLGFNPIPGGANLDEVRRHGPMALLGLTAMLLVFSAGEQSLYYTPSEVAFLFAGPYRKRQLVTYKLVTTLCLVFLTSLLMVASTRMIAPSIGAAFVGSFLFLAFIQFLQILIGLGIDTAGALAWSRGRQFFLAALVVLIGLTLASVGRELFEVDSLSALRRVEDSPIARVLATPFRPFVLAFTARGPGSLATWGLVGLLIDGVFVLAIYALDARYLEAASNASARRFAKIQRMLGGGGGIKAGARQTGRFGFKPPEAPWWGGVGPNLWRQATMALGSPGRLALVAVLLGGFPTFFSILDARDPIKNLNILYLSEGMVLYMSFLITGLLPYDFRGDIDMMEELKALPIAPSRVALGQIITPVAITTVAQMLGLLVALGLATDPGVIAWSVLLYLPPINLILFAVENVLFLWYPSRMVAGQVDVMAVGRQMLFTFARLGVVLAGIALAGGVGGLAYWITGGSRSAVLASSWIVLLGLSLALLPLVGLAFARFDVARDVPA